MGGTKPLIESIDAEGDRALFAPRGTWRECQYNGGEERQFTLGWGVHTVEDLECIILSDSPSASDADAAESSSSSCVKPRASISAGGRVLSGTCTLIRSRGPVSLAEVGDSRGSSMLRSPVIIL